MRRAMSLESCPAMTWHRRARVLGPYVLATALPNRPPAWRRMQMVVNSRKNAELCLAACSDRRLSIARRHGARNAEFLSS